MELVLPTPFVVTWLIGVLCGIIWTGAIFYSWGRSRGHEEAVDLMLHDPMYGIPHMPQYDYN